jgi:hypothetical protein
VKHHTKAKGHQINFLTQRVENKGRWGTKEVGHNRGKGAEENEVKYRTKVTEHQVNCLAQRVEDKGRRGDNEGHPSSHLCGAHRDRG